MKVLLPLCIFLISGIAMAEIRVEMAASLNEAGIGYSRTPIMIAPSLSTGERVIGCAVARKKKIDKAIADIKTIGGCKAYPFDATVSCCDLDGERPLANFAVNGYGIYRHRYIAFCVIEKS